MIQYTIMSMGPAQVLVRHKVLERAIHFMVVDPLTNPDLGIWYCWTTGTYPSYYQAVVAILTRQQVISEQEAKRLTERLLAPSLRQLDLFSELHP